MADNQTYLSFLDRANAGRAASAQVRNEASRNPVLQDQGLGYLASESDEPFLAVSYRPMSYTEPLAPADFQRLVGEAGDVRTVCETRYAKYANIMGLVRLKGTEGKVTIYEIVRGTRIYVYFMTFDGAQGELVGVSSVKIES